MKKVIFIKVHPPYTVCQETEWAKREYRERWLIRQTKQFGYDAKLFLLSNAKEVWTWPDDVEVSFFPVDNKTVAKQQHTSKLMLKRILKEKPDLIVFKGLAYKFSSWLLENTNFEFPFAFIVGGHCIDKYLNKASYILAETQLQIKENFKNYQCDILPKSLNLDVFKPNSEKKFDIVNVSSFEHRKNHPALFQFFKDYKVALVGSGPDWNKVKIHANDNVYMPGNLDTSEVAKIVSQSKIMVHPSIWEGFPRTIIESLACEVPVVALSSTIKDLIQDGKHGYLTTESNLYIKAKELLINNSLRKELGQNGRKLAVENFSVESTIPVLQKMFQTLFNEE